MNEVKTTRAGTVTVAGTRGVSGSVAGVRDAAGAPGGEGATRDDAEETPNENRQR